MATRPTGTAFLYSLFQKAPGPIGRAMALSIAVGREGEERARQLVEQDEAEEGEIVANVSSSCIEQLRYRDGVITVVFFRGGARVYTYPGDQQLFEAFASAPSVGAFFNAHFAP